MIPTRLLVRSGPESSRLFKEISFASAAESKTTRIFPENRDSAVSSQVCDLVFVWWS